MGSKIELCRHGLPGQRQACHDKVTLDGHCMAKTTTLNAKNLEALGAERLAALLIEISTGDTVAKRR
ncbi:MAG: DUF6880 family protein, partial [Pigmentiphaga sp.]